MFNTLDTLEKRAKEAKEEAEKARLLEEQEKERDHLEQVERMRKALADWLTDVFGFEPGYIYPMLSTEKEYRPGKSRCYITVPGVNPDVAKIGLKFVARPIGENDELEFSFDSNAPCHILDGYRSSGNYSSLGEVLIIARDRQARADEYNRRVDAYDLKCAEEIAKRKVKEEQEHTDRIRALENAISQYPFLKSVFDLILYYLDYSENMRDELEEAGAF